MHVYLLTVVLSDVANQHIACRKNKTRTKGIAQTVGKNLLFFRFRAKERIIGRDGIGAVVFNVDAKDFPEQGLCALGVTAWFYVARTLVLGIPTVTGADIKITFVPTRGLNPIQSKL